MKTITFKTLKIQNFLSIGKPITITFNNGINIITGINKDKDDANGVGKSAICDGLYFAIFGETLRPLKKQYIVNNIAKKNCVVELIFDINKNGVITQYRIERGLEPSYCKTFVNDVEDETLSTIPVTNLYILNLINTTQSVFKNTITTGINNSIPFMAQKKNEKREFIEGILRLEIFKAMTKVAKDNYDTIFKDYTVNIKLYQELETNIQNFTTRRDDHDAGVKVTINDLMRKIVDKMSTIDSIRKTLVPIDVAEINTIDVNINKLISDNNTAEVVYKDKVRLVGELKGKQTNNNKQIALLTESLRKYKIEFDTYPAYDIKINTIPEFQTLIVNEKDKIKVWESERTDQNYTIRDLQKENTTLSSIGSVCNKCNRPFPQQDVAQNSIIIDNNTRIMSEKGVRIRDINTMIENATLLIKKAEVTIKILEQRKTKTEFESDNATILTDLELNNTQVTELETQQQEFKKLLTVQQDKKTELKMAMQTYTYALQLIANYQKEIEHYEDTIKTQKELKNPFTDLIDEAVLKKTNLETLITDLKEKIAVYDVIKHIVSDDGIKAFIIKKMLGVLNERLNYYLTSMDSNCKLIFDEYFSDTIINDRGIECDYNNFSGGERKRIDLACLFAFMDIRRLQGDVSFNLAFYDELLDSALSATGGKKVFNILKERLDNYKESSYIITHKSENLKNTLINNIIYLEKSGGITKLEEYKELS